MFGGYLSHLWLVICSNMGCFKQFFSFYLGMNGQIKPKKVFQRKEHAEEMFRFFLVELTRSLKEFAVLLLLWWDFSVTVALLISLNYIKFLIYDKSIARDFIINVFLFSLSIEIIATESCILIRHIFPWVYIFSTLELNFLVQSCHWQ